MLTAHVESVHYHNHHHEVSQMRCGKGGWKGLCVQLPSPQSSIASSLIHLPGPIHSLGPVVGGVAAGPGGGGQPPPLPLTRDKSLVPTAGSQFIQTVLLSPRSSNTYFFTSRGDKDRCRSPGRARRTFVRTGDASACAPQTVLLSIRPISIDGAKYSVLVPSRHCSIMTEQGANNTSPHCRRTNESGFGI